MALDTLILPCEYDFRASSFGFCHGTEPETPNGAFRLQFRNILFCPGAKAALLPLCNFNGVTHSVQAGKTGAANYVRRTYGGKRDVRSLIAAE